MFTKQTEQVTIPAKEYRRLLSLEEQVRVLRQFYFTYPQGLETHSAINAIFDFDNQAREISII